MSTVSSSEGTTRARSPRIDLIDAARGFSVILMVIHHFLFDLVDFLGAPIWLFYNPVFNVLQAIFAGLFIFLCGVSSRFSRSNLKRGGKTAAAALAISVVTYFMGMPILFGILHLLAVCMILYGLLGRWIERISQKIAPFLWIVLIVLSALAVARIPAWSEHVWALGWTTEAFFSADYFPIFPWVFVFLLGTWAGEPIRERKLPKWFYEKKAPLFARAGRHSFLIYLAHQPILYGLTMLILKIRG